MHVAAANTRAERTRCARPRARSSALVAQNKKKALLGGLSPSCIEVPTFSNTPFFHLSSPLCDATTATDSRTTSTRLSCKTVVVVVAYPHCGASSSASDLAVAPASARRVLVSAVGFFRHRARGLR